MSRRWIFSLIMLAVAPGAAAAQFTTFLTPPNPTKDSIKAAIVAEQKAIDDSVTRAQVANMKTWVDSVAGISVPPADSIVTVQTVQTLNGDTIVTRTTTANGLVAPNTASPVPFLLVTGIAALLVGIAMVRRPTPRARARRVDRR